MPWTLYRYILKELIRILLLSTAALVLVIGFAVSIKPLMDGVLGPVGLVKLLLYTIPTVLGFAVPFSAAFSSTLVFCRMTSDNEVQACRAVGLSYGTILLPVVMLGLVLTLLMYYMGNSIIPSFYKSADDMVQKNLIQMIVTQVQRGEPVELPNSSMVIYARSAQELPAPHLKDRKVQPNQHFVFHAVAVGQIAADGTLRSDTTAETAELLLFNLPDGDTWYEMMLHNVMHVEKGQLVSSELLPVVPERLPNPLRDRVRFKSWPELLDLLRTPENFPTVRDLKAKLVSAMSTERLLEAFQAELASGPRAKATLLGENGDERYIVSGPQTYLDAKEQKLVLSATGMEHVRVEKFQGSLPAIRDVMPMAVLRVTTKDAQPQVELEMYDVTQINVRESGPPGGVTTQSVKGLRWSGPTDADLAHASALELLPVARKRFGRIAPVMAAARNMAEEIDQLGRRLICTAFQRAASAVACLLVLVLGAVLSIKLKHTLPLVVYFWIFMLAFLAVIITNSGDKLAAGSSRPLAIALTAIWSGDLILLIALTLNYWVVTRT